MSASDLLTPEQKAALEKDALETPICPHCKADPFLVALREFTLGGKIRTFIYYCSACRKALNCQAISGINPKEEAKRVKIYGNV